MDERNKELLALMETSATLLKAEAGFFSEDDYDTIKGAVAGCLDLIKPREPLGTELFNAVARISVSVAIETAALREREGQVEILLTQRSAKESAYPGMWNSPGSFLRPGEQIQDVLKRISDKEFGAPIRNFQFVGFFNYLDEARGHTLHLIFLVDVEPTQGTWFKVTELPASTVLHHQFHAGLDGVVDRAYAKFVQP